MNLSIKRRARADRKVTTKGERDGRCIRQEIHNIGFWSTGEPKQIVVYLHVTKGWRRRLLTPLHRKVAFA